jgi:hypothetical protein
MKYIKWLAIACAVLFFAIALPELIRLFCIAVLAIAV